MKTAYNQVMEEFQALEGLEWLEKGACIEEAFQLEGYTPKCVFGGMGDWEIDEDLEEDETALDLEYAKRWVDRLS